MLIVPNEIMNYKQAKKTDQLVTKVRMIRGVMVNGYLKCQVAQSFSCHRNTVGNLIKRFKKIPQDHQNQLLYHSLDKELLIDLASSLEDLPSTPVSHPKKATCEQEKLVVEIFYELKKRFGYAKLYTIIKRRLTDHPDGPTSHPLYNLTKSQVRGIYSRQGLKAQRIRTKAKTTRHLYDYKTLGVFENLHFDTKHICDQRALPANV